MKNWLKKVWKNFKKNSDKIINVIIFVAIVGSMLIPVLIAVIDFVSSR